MSTPQLWEDWSFGSTRWGATSLHSDTIGCHEVTLKWQNLCVVWKEQIGSWTLKIHWVYHAQKQIKPRPRPWKQSRDICEPSLWNKAVWQNPWNSFARCVGGKWIGLLFLINQDASIWLILMCKSRIYTFEKNIWDIETFMLPRSKVSLSGAIDEAKLHGCLHRSGQENPSTNNTSSVIRGTVPTFYAEIVIGCPSICQETLWVVGLLWCWSSIVPPAVCSKVSFSYWWKASFVRCKIWWYFNSHISCTLEKCFVGWKGNCISTDVQRDTTHFFLHHVSIVDSKIIPKYSKKDFNVVFAVVPSSACGGFVCNASFQILVPIGTCVSQLHGGNIAAKPLAGKGCRGLVPRKRTKEVFFWFSSLPTTRHAS